MVDFTPKTPDESVNYNSSNTIKDFFSLSIILLFIIALVVVLVNKSSQVISRVIPISYELDIVSKLGKADGFEILQANQLVDNYLQEVLPDIKGKLKVYELCSDEVNAFASLGGRIFFTTGILKRMKTIDQFEAVLFHEVGHILNRHLTGRLLSFMTQALIPLPGFSLARKAQEFGNLNFSRNAELEADNTAKNYLFKKYGNHNGEFSLYNVLDKSDQPEIFSTHPSHSTRQKNLVIDNDFVAGPFNLKSQCPN